MVDEGRFVRESATTDTVPAGERAEFWTELLCSYHCRMSCDVAPVPRFRGHTVREWTNTYQIVGWRQQGEVSIRRTQAQIRQDADDDYRFFLPLNDHAIIRRDGVEVLIDARSGALTTANRTFSVTFGDSYRGLVMTIPWQEVHGRLGASPPAVAGVDAATGLGRVVRDMAVGLVRERDRLQRTEFDAVGDRLTELLCMLAVGDDRPDAPGHLADVEAMVRRYVREHAGDAGLSGSSVARAVGWSLRKVQLTLHQAGTTLRDVIREERLRLARERLGSPAYQHRSISAIALGTGFSSGSALSTAFRQRYGITPRDYRYGSSVRDRT